MDLCNYLFSSVVGSHMWGMENENSDLDVCIVFLSDIVDFFTNNCLDAKFNAKVKFKNQDLQEQFIYGNLLRQVSILKDPLEIDVTYWNFNHFIGLLKKGNLNAIWVLFSPLQSIYPSCISSSFDLGDLKRVMSGHFIPCEAWNAIKGMIKGAMKRYGPINEKKLFMLTRNINQFESCLHDFFNGVPVEYIFNPVTKYYKEEELERKIIEMDEKIPEKKSMLDVINDRNELLNGILLDVRFSQVKANINISLRLE